MKYEVKLKLHQDDATGEWGLAHHDTISVRQPFNAFWEPAGIFHDVFEHNHEHSKYFDGKYAITLWGEVVASGKALAYNDRLGIDNFQYRGTGPARDFTADTIGEVEEYIYELGTDSEHAYMRYDMTKETCAIPYQEYLNPPSLNYTIQNYIDALYKQMDKHNIKKSPIWIPGITRCYTYGYKQGSKLIGKDWSQAYDVMQKFLDDWHSICTDYKAEHLAIDGSDFGLKYIKFMVNNNSGKLNVRTKLIDDVGNEYPLDKLMEY